jgi:hypothetical protein
MEKLLRKFEDVTAWNACPEQNSEDLRIRERIDASMKQLLARLLMVRQFLYSQSTHENNNMRGNC